MVKKILLSSFFIFLFSFYNSLFPVVKGSDSAVSIEPYETFPASDSDNKICGFAWFKNGFSLEDNTTTCTFDAVYPVSGNIDLNGGTLYLSQDLFFKNVTNILGLGTIVGNNHIVSFCSSIGQFPSEKAEFQNLDVSLNSDLLLTDSIVIKGDCKILGNGYDIILGDNGCIVVDSNAKLRLSNVVLEGINTDNFIMSDDTASLVLENVTWKQSGHYSFTKGSIKFLNENDFIGTYSFVYDSKFTSTICGHSKWAITDGMCIRIGRKNSTSDANPIYFEDETSVLKLNNCTCLVTGLGMMLKRGKAEVDSDVYLDIVGTDTTTGLVLGSGQEEDDFIMHLNSGASLNFLSGQLMYNNYRNDRVTAFSGSSRILRYADSKMYIATDWIFPCMILKVDSGVPQTTLKDGVAFSYNGTKFIFRTVEYDLSGHQSGSYNFYLNGNDYLYLTKGTFAIPLIISGNNNLICGVGNFSGNIILQDSNSDFTLSLNGLILEDIHLNGGTVTLAGDLSLGADSNFSGDGTVDISSYNFDMSGLDSTWTGTILWRNNGGAITLNSNANLSGKWIFEDTCIINGNGHTIDVGQTGQILVKDGSQLTLRNVSLHMVSQNDVQLESDTSSIVLDSVKWVQDTDIIFDKGSIKFLNTVEFIGSYSFLYDSSRTSTIEADSKWKISGDMILRIGRKEAENYVEPIYFENSTSVLRLSDCSFIITASGAQFTRGTIGLHGEVNLETISTATTNGLILGSGKQGEDITIKASARTSLNFLSGMLVYNNYNDDFVKSLSESARFIRYGDSKVYVARSWIFPPMVLKVASGMPDTILADGVTFSYNGCHLVFENVEFDFKGKQFGPSSFSLDGNDFVYLNKGNCMLPLAVSGSGNTIHGSGTVSGGVTLQDSDSELTMDLNGVVWNSIDLNGGALTMMGDLHLGGDYTIEGPGQVRLMRYNIILGSQDSVWESTINWHSNGLYPCPYNFPRGIDFNSDLMLLGKWNIQDCCVINGHGHSLCLGESGKIEVQEGVCLKLRNMTIHSAGESNIYCTEDSSSITFDNVTWIQDSQVTFTKGSMCFVNDVDFIGSHSFVYDSSQTSTIKEDSSWRIAGNMILRIGKKEVEGSLEPLYFANNTSSIKLDNCTFLVTGSGFAMTRGKFNISGDVALDITGTTTSIGFTFGTYVEGEDAIFQLNAGSILHFTNGMFVYNNYSKDGFVALSENATIIRYGGTSAYINSDWTIPYLVIKAALGFPETIIREGVKLRYDGTHLTFSESCFEYTGSQSASNGYFVLEGNDYIFIDKGAFVFPITVTGSGNAIYGAGGFNGIIELQDSNSELIFGINGTLGTSPQMNGGTIILGDDLYLTGGTTLLGSGRIDLAGYKLAFGAQDLTWDSSVFWDGGNVGCLDIRARVDLVSTWTLSGKFTLNGYGNIVNLSNGGDIVIDKDSDVTFRNIKITGISENNIRCLDDDGVIILDDVSWVQDNNYSFTVGALKIKDNVRMEGSYEFAYQTKMTSTVLADSSLRFSPGFTFNYDPYSESKYLIEMIDDTSLLLFNGSTLHAAATGLDLTDGKLCVLRDSFLSSEITTTVDNEGYDVTIDEGITFGNGDSLHDLGCDIFSGVSLCVTQGSLHYKNVLSASWDMHNFTSVLYMYENTRLNLYQNLDLGVGSLLSGDNVVIGRATGKDITGSIRPQGLLLYTNI
ncbi:hypothetical protein ACFLYA_00455 [Candidatus Dependentiae bacterium]